MNRRAFFLCTLSFISLAGCVATAPVAPATTASNQLTTGQVQLTLKKGVTTQQQVLESFGAPNLVTVSSDGEEVWTYQRAATVTQATSSSAYGTIILFGGSNSSSGLEQASRTMTLIIKFRESGGIKRVSSFTSRASSF